MTTEPIRHCAACQTEVRCEASVQKKASKATPAGTEVWRCPTCGRVLARR